MARRSVEERFHDAIEFAVTEYRDHSRITRPKVIRWLKQFPTRTRPLGAKVLRSVDYYSDSNIRSLARQLAQAAYQEYSEINKTHVYFVPIGGAGSGAHQVARHLRTMRLVPSGCVIDLLELHRKQPEDVGVVVLFDDFSGTGQAVKEWWDINESIIRPKEAHVVLGLLVLNHLARATLEEITDQIMAVKELLAAANVFHEGCTEFSQNEKRSLLSLCRKTGCAKEYMMGRGECGLLVVFKHGCPNNSIPILWHHNEGVWESLFQRRGT